MNISLITLICLGTAVVSAIAFKKSELLEKFMFRPERILAHKEWHRLFSSALIHANWGHLAFNLLALYSFGEQVEFVYSPLILFLIYAASILGGSLLSLSIHRHRDYSALGASGGVCGVVFASIFLVPGTNVFLFFIPIPIPGPIFAIIYLVGTFIALRRGKGNIGHDAHFGGAITGLILALVIAPQNCLSSPALFIGSLLISIAGLWVIAKDPFNMGGRILPFGGPKPMAPGGRERDYQEALARRKQRDEVDRILEKVSEKGINSLSEKERELLEKVSRRNKS